MRLVRAIVVLKLGADGCLVPTVIGASASRVAVCATVDATGAGDCFDGAFIARIAAGDDSFAAARYANAAAALATTGYGAVAPLASRTRCRATAERRGLR